MPIDPNKTVFTDEACELLDEMRNDSPEARDYADRWADILFTILQNKKN